MSTYALSLSVAGAPRGIVVLVLSKRRSRVVSRYFSMNRRPLRMLL
jgi:hypothetical protein